MNDRGQDDSKDKTPELLKVLPFMSAFPFTDYEITLVEHGQDFITMGVSPILINAFGDTGTIDMLNFNYVEGESNISISVFKEDVEWIVGESTRVKKMDQLRAQLDEALETDDLAQKVKSVRTGKKFAKQIDCDSMGGIDLEEVLTEFLKAHETVLRSNIKLGIQKLSVATLKSADLSERQFRAVSAFLNFQIHYSKILLGIVIAAKIY